MKAKAAGSKFNHIAIVKPRIGTALAIDDDTIAFDSREIGDAVGAEVHTVDGGVIAVHGAGWNSDIVVLLAADAQHVAQNCEARTAAADNFEIGVTRKLRRLAAYFSQQRPDLYWQCSDASAKAVAGIRALRAAESIDQLPDPLLFDVMMIAGGNFGSAADT